MITTQIINKKKHKSILCIYLNYKIVKMKMETLLLFPYKILESVCLSDCEALDATL